MNPAGGRRLYISHHSCETTGSLEASQEVNVIAGSSDAFRDSAQTAKNSTQVAMKSFSPGFGYQSAPFFGAENQMVMKAEVSGCHLDFGPPYDIQRARRRMIQIILPPFQGLSELPHQPRARCTRPGLISAAPAGAVGQSQRHSRR